MDVKRASTSLFFLWKKNEKIKYFLVRKKILWLLSLAWPFLDGLLAHKIRRLRLSHSDLCKALGLFSRHFHAKWGRDSHIQEFSNRVLKKGSTYVVGCFPYTFSYMKLVGFYKYLHRVYYLLSYTLTSVMSWLYGTHEKGPPIFLLPFFPFSFAFSTLTLLFFSSQSSFFCMQMDATWLRMICTLSDNAIVNWAVKILFISKW